MGRGARTCGCFVVLWCVNVFGNQMCTIVAIVCQSNYFILWLNCAALRDKDDLCCVSAIGKSL